MGLKESFQPVIFYSCFPNNIIVAVWSFLFLKDNKGIISVDHIYGDKNAKFVLE